MEDRYNTKKTELKSAVEWEETFRKQAEVAKVNLAKVQEEVQEMENKITGLLQEVASTSTKTCLIVGEATTGRNKGNAQPKKGRKTRRRRRS